MRILDPDCEYPLDSGSCYMGQNDKLFSDGLSKSKWIQQRMTCNGCKSANPKEPDVDDVILENNEYYVFKAVGRKEYDLSPAVFLSE